METLIDPIKTILTALGLSRLNDYAGVLAIPIYGLFILSGNTFLAYIKKTIRTRKEIKTFSDLHPTFDEVDILDKTEIYIPPRFQLSSPTIDFLPDYVTDNNAIPFFSNPNQITVIDKTTYDLLGWMIHDVFKTPRSLFGRFMLWARTIIIFTETKKSPKTLTNQRFFFILGDTGMGKTAFLVNLYFGYLKQKNKKYKIKLFPLTIDDIEEKIKSITDKENTILLLDSLDEDSKASYDVNNRIIELLNISKDFRKVLFTCRTQFFSDEKDEPNETYIKKHGGIGEHRFGKIYLSNFSEADILKFIDKKYKKHSVLHKKAIAISKEIPDVCVRPMVMKYFDDFLEGKRNLTYKSDIYELIVEKWVEREKYNVPVNKRSNFRENLLNFSRDVAQSIYLLGNSTLTISSTDLDGFASEHDISLNSLELRSRSLLHRAHGNHFKFSHKSILEYFLADHLYHSKEFLNSFNKSGFDAAYSFYLERCEKLNTLAYFKQLCGKDLNNLTKEDRESVIDTLSKTLKINRRTLEVIIWREDKRRNYRLDRSLLGEIKSIKLPTDITDGKILDGLKNSNKSLLNFLPDDQ